jgi:hypothetical protein
MHLAAFLMLDAEVLLIGWLLVVKAQAAKCWVGAGGVGAMAHRGVSNSPVKLGAAPACILLQYCSIANSELRQSVAQLRKIRRDCVPKAGTAASKLSRHLVRGQQ